MKIINNNNKKELLNLYGRLLQIILALIQVYTTPYLILKFVNKINIGTFELC